MASRPRIIALIVAAGSGSRAGGELPKQFRLVRGQPMLRHSYAALAGHPDIDSDMLWPLVKAKTLEAQAALRWSSSRHIRYRRRNTAGKRA